MRRPSGCGTSSRLAPRFFLYALSTSYHVPFEEQGNGKQFHKTMKRKICVLSVVVLYLISTSAQDVIVKKDGSTILSKVLEVNESTIRYKKYSNPSGPLYTIDKATILSINYENGEKESFENSTGLTESSSSNSTEISTPTVQKAQVDIQRNSSLIAAYNKRVEFKKAKSKKSPAKYSLLKYGVTSESVLSNEDVEVRIKFDKDRLFDEWSRAVTKGFYSIAVYNKTSQVIYLDLGNAYRIEPDGICKTFYDGKQVSVSNTKGSGIGIGLGSVANVMGIGGPVGALASGIGISGSKSTSVTTTYNNQRIVSIPPHAWGYVSKYADALHEGKRTVLSTGEEFTLAIEKGVINKRGVLEYTEHDSPATIRFVLTYSKDALFSSYSNIEFGLYLQQIFGDYFNTQPLSVHGQMWEGIHKYIPNYGNGDYIILGFGEKPYDNGKAFNAALPHNYYIIKNNK